MFSCVGFTLLIIVVKYLLAILYLNNKILAMQEADESKKIIQRVANSIQKNRQSQLFYKAFLRPIQIALKTSSTQKDIQKQGCLPYGLKQVCKANIEDNKYILTDFQDLDSGMKKLREQKQRGTNIDRLTATKIANKQYQIDDVKKANCDNLISLIKGRPGIKIAICVCMYSQDKSMLKRTLSGISQNIKVFANNGYSYNDIGVFIIMDGIQVVDPSVEQYFQELQKDNNIYLNDDVQATDPRDLMDQTRQVEDQEVDNLNHLIFNPEQFEDRKKRRFASRKKQYKMYKEMIAEIQKLQKDKTLTYDGLDATLQRFFIQKAKQQYKKEYAATDDDIKHYQDQIFLDIYATNIRTGLPIIRDALNEAKKYCKQYLSTRDNLALLNSFRVSMPTGVSKVANKNRKKYQQLQQESQSQESLVKMNLFMVTKYKNRGKLSSHNWFFNGFCQQLKPTYSVLLDVGLTPQKDALYKMCQYMHKDQKVGGVCGYMGLRIQRLEQNEEVKDDSIDCITSFCMKFVDIQRAQQFEYHFAHLIDKPFQSMFNFIHVLPGAFSAYRMKALRPQGEADSQLLKQYFKSIDENALVMSHKAYPYTVWQTLMKVALPDFLYFCFFAKPQKDSYQALLYDQNVYLAQDRTLCMGIHKNGYDLEYLPDANAWVDPIKTLYGLLGQRKRWINGSFFAFQKVKSALEGDAGNTCLKLQIAYLTLMNMLAYISPALFMYTIHIAMFTFQANVIFYLLSTSGFTLSQQSTSVGGVFVYVVDFIYSMIFLGLVFFSMHLTNRQTRFRSFFYGVSTIYGIFSLSVFGVLIYDIISGFIGGKNEFLMNNPWFVQQIHPVYGETLINSLRFIMLGIMSLYVIPITVFLVFCKFQYIIDILFSTVSFLFFGPTYLNILNIYALCRMDDISWGTKGLNSDGSGRNKQMMDDWKKIRLVHVSKFVLYNVLVAFFLLLFGDNYVTRFWMTFIIMILLGSTLVFKVVLGAIYLIIYKCCKGVKVSQNSQAKHPDDDIHSHFRKVKDSLYKGVERSILGIKQQIKGKDITLQSVALVSKIYMSLRKNNLKQRSSANRFSNQFNNLSKVQKKNEQKLVQKINEKINQSQQNIIKQEHQRTSDNLSAKGYEQKVININQKEPNQKGKKFVPKRNTILGSNLKRM